MFGAAIGFFAFLVLLSVFAINNNQRHPEKSAIIERSALAASLFFAMIIGVFSQWGLYLVVQSAVKNVVK